MQKKTLEPDVVDVEPTPPTAPGTSLYKPATTTHAPRDHALALPDLTNQDPASSYLARLAPGSRRTQGFALRKITKVLGGGDDPRRYPWHLLTYQHTRAFLLRMENEVTGESTHTAPRPLSFTTVNRHTAALKGVLQEAWRMGLMSAEQYMRAKDPLKPVRGHRLPKGRRIKREELDAFLRVCSKDPTVYGIRDLAIFTLLCFGLRRHEIVGARLDAYDRENGVVSVVGKGNKERDVALSDNATAFLNAWLKIRPETEHETWSPYIVTSRGGKELTPQAVAAILAKRARQAKIDPKSLTAHDFRRTFISNLLDDGVDITTVQKLVGHSDTTTTGRYDRRGLSAAKEAVKKVRWGP